MSLEDNLDIDNPENWENEIKDVREESRRIGVLLGEFVSYQEVRDLENYAFECTEYEIEYSGVDRKYANALHTVRRCEYLLNIYNLAIQRLNEDPTISEMSLLPATLEEGYASVRERYGNKPGSAIRKSNKPNKSNKLNKSKSRKKNEDKDNASL